MAAHFGTDPVAIEAARLRLANAILAVTHNDSRDVSALKTAALAILARTIGWTSRREVRPTAAAVVGDPQRAAGAS